jgi:hypothetical protein
MQENLMPTIQVHPNAGPNDNNFSPLNNPASAGGSVAFTVSPSGSTANVYTYQNNVSINAFTAGSPPYSAPTPPSQPYTLASGVSGTIVLSLSSTPPGPLQGLNGTINVGGGSDHDHGHGHGR